MTITVMLFHKVTGWVPFEVYGPSAEAEARKVGAMLAAVFSGVELHWQGD